MALPIFAYYINKVYADPSLDYTQQDQFDIPEDFDPCGSMYAGSNHDDELLDIEEMEELVE